MKYQYTISVAFLYTNNELPERKKCKSHLQVPSKRIKYLGINLIKVKPCTLKTVGH